LRPGGADVREREHLPGQRQRLEQVGGDEVLADLVKSLDHLVEGKSRRPWVVQPVSQFL
jgi:hypothetical protein